MSPSAAPSRFATFATLAVAVATAACAKKQPPPPPAVQASANQVLITAHDYAFEAPDSIPAGLEEFHLVNQGPHLHHLQIVQLDSGKTVGDLVDAMKKPGPLPLPAWVHWLGGPNAPVPNGMDTSTAYVTLSPGSYAMICLIPDSLGVPHVALGMAHAFTVTATGATPATEPQPDIVVHLKDYAFDVTGNVTAGTHVIRIVNDGPQVHEMFLGQLAPGKTTADLVNFVERDHLRGRPPARPVGGSTFLSPGASDEIRVTLTPGDYGLFCFVPGPDGRDHVLHGMVKELKVS